jgi:fructosamine-3-kinase
MIELIKSDLKQELEIILNERFHALVYKPIAGGSINQVYQLTLDNTRHFCCKVNVAAKFPHMFRAEKAGLEVLSAQAIIRVPAVEAVLLLGEYQVLILEWIEQGERTPTFWKSFGAKLSLLHAVDASAYGFNHDNYMGALPQCNKQETSWPRFFFEQRLLPQVKLALDRNLLGTKSMSQAENIAKLMHSEFPDNLPSLQHGDLWSGNFLCDKNAAPVLIDPAVYYGHPAVDLGLTTLFGGFDTAFYDAYNYYKPFPSNHKTQWEICNLYPLLVHLNLFGRGDLGEVMQVLNKYS